MYAPSIIQQKIEKLQAARLPDGNPLFDFELKRHSYDEVQSRVADLNKLVPDDVQPWNDRARPMKPTRNLKPDEVQFIRNERAISACDFAYWGENYAKIVFDEQLMPLRLNVAQQITVAVWGEMEALGMEIAEIKLKARQLGVSTVTEAAIAHRVQFHPRVNSVVASSVPAQSAKMAKMMETIWDNEPWWMLPFCDRYNAGELIEFGYLKSLVSIQHGNQFRGISRGDTPTAAHLSECSEYTNAEELVDASLLNCMHASPNIFIVLESTAKGINNWWHRTWEDSKAGYAEGIARLHPGFLPWFVGRDIYPTKTWMEARPIPRNWIPATITEKHAERAKGYVRTNPMLSKYLGPNWEMPREQMWYWEIRRAEAVRKKILAQFLQEMPADDQEAFQSTNISCFEVDVIAEHRERANPPVGVYGITGAESEIPLRLQPSTRDMLTKDQQENLGIRPIKILAHWNPMDVPHEYILHPLKFEGISGFDPMGKLFIFEHPEPDEEYGVGVDTSEGIGKDRSVVEVIRKGTIFRNDAQVAEYANPLISAYDLWPIVLSVLTYFSTPRAGRRRQAKAIIECKGNGETTQLEIKKRGWAHFHQWVRYADKRIKQAEAHQIGFRTNSWSRPMVMDILIKSLRDFWLDIHSPYFITEMVSLSKDEHHQDMRAEYGGYDDRIFALGIALFSMHALEIIGRGKSIVQERMEHERMMAEYPTYQGGMSSESMPSFRKGDTELQRVNELLSRTKS